MTKLRFAEAASGPHQSLLPACSHDMCVREKCAHAIQTKHVHGSPLNKKAELFDKGAVPCIVPTLRSTVTHACSLKYSQHKLVLHAYFPEAPMAESHF